jgi:FKBP-type peptidyl-prolyl cis-trans isomerase
MKRLTYILILFMFFSCTKKYNEDFAVGQNEQVNKEQAKDKKIDSCLTEANRIITQKEEQRIESYVKRRNWQIENHSGVYVQIIKRGQGKRIIEDNSTVSIEYEKELLSGETETSSKNKGKKEFKEKGDVNIEEGLLIGIKGMQKGCQARVIIPSNLAFVINDDGEKIEANNTIIYTIKIIDIK